MDGWNFRRIFWWLFLVAFGAGNILLHEQANEAARQIVRLMGLSPFLWSTRLLAVAGVTTVLFFLRGRLFRNRAKLKRIAMLFPFALALDLSLIIYPSERIHYFQYSMLTWIAYKAIGKPLPAALMGFLFGYLDEAHQFWVLYANDPRVYFDWNDVILNLMAAVAALVVLLPETHPVRKVPKQCVIAAVALWIVAAALLVTALNPDPHLMGNQNRSSFWITSGIATHYHATTALEGTIIVGIILILTVASYWPALSSRDVARETAAGMPRG